MLKRVFKAPDEFTAITVREMLKSRNIEAIVKPYETSWLDGLPKVMKGGWGDVLVHEENEEEAKKCVDDFLRGTAAEEDHQ